VHREIFADAARQFHSLSAATTRAIQTVTDRVRAARRDELLEIKGAVIARRQDCEIISPQWETSLSARRG